MQLAFWPDTGPTLSDTETCATSALTTSPALISSAADSPARTSATPGSGPGWRVSVAAYGSSSPALLASYDHATCSWRTSQHFLDGELTPFSATWPRSGTMLSGIAYRLPPLVPRISATEYSFWPTPQTQYDGRSMEAWQAARGRARERHKAGQYGKGTGVPTMIDLQRAAQLWPTPTARDWRSGKASAATHARNSRPLNEVAAQGQASGQLNPTWVEWLMGFPLGWTDLEDSATP